MVQEELGLLSQRVRVRVVEEAAQQRAVQEKVVVDLRQKGQECAKVRGVWSVGGGGGDKWVGSQVLQIA